MPALSVVVPIYNVSDYLVACLESLAGQTLDDLEVVLVDDGSTDGSGDMADDFATGRDRWKVLHVENGGLGRARNIGMDHSTSDYVAFVDSDDLVPRDAYELMLHAVSESGSDMVVGGVLRFDGARAFQSPLHRRAIQRTQMRTHIHKTPSLIYDSTAWNKIYRRAFLAEHGLRFPEGVYYEDIPLTLPAHFLASSVDVLEDPVYLWRERQTAVQSITQRRAETKNLVDRMAAVTGVDDFLTERGDMVGKGLHDAKVLRIDIPLFIDVLHEGDDAFREHVMALAAEYLSRVPAGSIAALPPVRRLQYHLISRGMLPELLEVQEWYRVPANRGNFVRHGMRLYADLPFRTDPSKGIPSSVYETTRSQPLRTGVRDVRWDRDNLVVEGHAFIHRVSEATAASSVRRFQLRRIGAPAGERTRVRSKRVKRPDLTALTTGLAVSYDAAGFRARISRQHLLLPAGSDETHHELVAQVAAPSARRGSSVGNPELGPGRFPHRRLIAQDQLVVPGYRGRVLDIAVHRVSALLEWVEVDGDTIRLRARCTSGEWSPTDLYLRRTDALHGLRVPMVVDGRTATATVTADELEVRSASFGTREWMLGLVAHDAPEEAGAAALHMAPEMDDVFNSCRGRSLVVREGEGGARLFDARPGPVVTDFSWRPDGLHLTGVVGGAHMVSLTISTGGGSAHTLPVGVDGEWWTAHLPARGEPGSAALRWLEPGRWRFSLTTDDEGQRERAVRTSSTAEGRLGEEGHVDGIRYLLRSDARHELEVVVDAFGDYRDRGALHRERNRKYHYRLQRRLPLQDTIFFEAWKGRQFSDNPRAIFEELQRAGDPRECIWAVKDLSVEVPDGVRLSEAEADTTPRRHPGADRQPRLLPAPRPLPLGREQRLHADPLRQAGGQPVRPDLARHAAQADRLRHREHPDVQQELPEPVRQGRRQVGHVGVPERLLLRDPEPSLPLRRRGPRDRLPAQRHLPPARARRAAGRGDPAPAGPAGGQAGHPLRPDLARQRLRRVRALPVHHEARPRAHVPRVRARLRAPHPGSPAGGVRGGLDHVRRLRAQRVELSGHPRPVPRCRRAGDRLLVGDVRLRQHRPPDRLLHLGPRAVPRQPARLLLRLRGGGARPPAARVEPGDRRAGAPRRPLGRVRGPVCRVPGEVHRAGGREGVTAVHREIPVLSTIGRRPPPAVGEPHGPQPIP